jgi:hypothetical protein
LLLPLQQVVEPTLLLSRRRCDECELRATYHY